MGFSAIWTYHIVAYDMEPATGDLLATARYIAKELKEPVTALKLVAKIREAVMSLSDMPTRALVTDERLALLGILKLPVENHIVFYVISEKDMAVLCSYLQERMYLN